MWQGGSVDKIFVDTNVFLRFMLWDIPDQAAAAEALFERAARLEAQLVTSDLVMAELVWTLESYYGRTKDEIAGLLRGILGTPNLTVENEELIRTALKAYTEQNVDFIDAYSAAFMQQRGIDKAKSFDKHFKRFPGIELV